MIRRIGAHVSASGGVDKAIERAADIGCNAVQIFAGSPRSWQRLNLATVDTDKVYAKQKELDVSPIFTHSLYLVNFASDNPELLAKSIAAVSADLAFDALVNGGGVVVHLGSHQGRGWEAVREQVRDAVITVLQQTPANSCLLIENSAGQNGKVCSDLSEIRWLIDQVETLTGLVSANRLGWCFDTCHGWSAGYWMGTDDQWSAFTAQTQQTATDMSVDMASISPKNLYSELEHLQLFSHLKLIHVNDSRDPFNGHRDRHDNIQDGLIFQGLLEYFLNYAEIKDIPLVTEVPGLEGEGPDKANVERIKSLLQ